LHQEFEERTGHPLPVWKQEAPDCVGQAFALAVTIRLVLQPETFTEDCLPAYAAAEPIYGGSRYEIAYKALNETWHFSGSGTMGIWAVSWLLFYGIILRKSYGPFDLTEYDYVNSVSWGSQFSVSGQGPGVPELLEQFAKENPVNQIYQVGTYADARQIIHLGYPIVACTDIIFSKERDEHGFCYPIEDKYNHCICIVAIDELSEHAGLLVCDSLGSERAIGVTTRYDQPEGSFWITWTDAEKIFAQNESYAVGEIQLFCS
jgi:hypothetical protein